jgi:uncharacterized Zn finger protein
MGFYGYSEYVPVARKKANAAKELAKLRKKDPNVSPVVVEGRQIANTWWGTAWCTNLESYADYSNRIGRGRNYVRNGFVIDLRIDEGLITGKVYGSHLYTVTIKIDKLSEANIKSITSTVGRRIESVADLIEGKFPKEFGEAFLTQHKGLFPAPKEIHMSCTCPDGAYMCKHVAAVLYGAGARLDQDPLLFFKLRGVDVNSFIKASIDDKISALLKNAGKSSRRVIKGADVEEIFGLGGN